MSELVGDGFRLRRAGADDVGWLVELAARPEIADYLAAVSPWDEDGTRRALAAEPRLDGRFVLEVETDRGWSRAGGLAFSVENRRSRIAYLFGVMVDPAHRGKSLGAKASRALALHLVRELGYHRVQLEVYGFNEHAVRVFERAGFVFEGRRRAAYWRRDGWVDGVLFGLVAEDLDPPASIGSMR